MRLYLYISFSALHIQGSISVYSLVLIGQFPYSEKKIQLIWFCYSNFIRGNSGGRGAAKSGVFLKACFVKKTSKEEYFSTSCFPEFGFYLFMTSPNCFKDLNYNKT